MKQYILFTAISLLSYFSLQEVQAQSKNILETTPSEIEQVIEIIQKVGMQENIDSPSSKGARYVYTFLDGISMNDTSYSNVLISHVNYAQGKGRVATTAYEKNIWTVDIYAAYDGVAGLIDGNPEVGVNVNYNKAKAVYIALTTKDDGNLNYFGNDLKKLTSSNQKNWFHLIVDKFLEVHKDLIQE